MRTVNMKYILQYISYHFVRMMSHFSRTLCKSSPHAEILILFLYIQVCDVNDKLRYKKCKGSHNQENIYSSIMFSNQSFVCFLSLSLFLLPLSELVKPDSTCDLEGFLFIAAHLTHYEYECLWRTIYNENHLNSVNKLTKYAPTTKPQCM